MKKLHQPRPAWQDSWWIAVSFAYCFSVKGFLSDLVAPLHWLFSLFFFVLSYCSFESLCVHYFTVIPILLMANDCIKRTWAWVAVACCDFTRCVANHGFVKIINTVFAQVHDWLLWKRKYRSRWLGNLARSFVAGAKNHGPTERCVFDNWPTFRQSMDRIHCRWIWDQLVRHLLQLFKSGSSIVGLFTQRQQINGIVVSWKQISGRGPPVFLCKAGVGDLWLANIGGGTGGGHVGLAPQCFLWGGLAPHF